MSVDFTLLATGALSFTVALAWNRAVNQWFESRYPPSSRKATAAHALAAAVVITLVVIVLVEVLNRAHRYALRGSRGAGPPPRPRIGYWHSETGAEGGLGAPAVGFSPRPPAPARRAAPGGPELSCLSSECRACAHCFPRPIVTLWD